MHSHTRSHLFIDKFYNLGVCISYDRMLVLPMQLGNSVSTSTQLKSDSLVCTAKLLSNVFKTSAPDDTNYNPSSRSAKLFWNGTSNSST